LLQKAHFIAANGLAIIKHLRDNLFFIALPLRKTVLADIFAGPIIRRLTSTQLVLWWVSPYPCQGELQCFSDGQLLLNTPFDQHNLHTFRVGSQAVIHLLDVAIDLPCDTKIEYDLRVGPGQQLSSLSEIIKHINYQGQQRPSFVIQDKLTNLLHGSCRNPHHPSSDSLLAGDQQVAKYLEDPSQRPSLLMMSGDQIYADHVAGPTLYAIHQVIELLGLNNESFEQAQFSQANELYEQTDQYYQRERFLPLAPRQPSWFNRKDSEIIFTSTYAQNHLISLAENLAMYFLVWSPQLWQQIELSGFNVPAPYQDTYQQELTAIKEFAAGLPKVQRLLAHIPTYMIFDDHDVTDDWNLTAQWERNAYQHPFAKRIIGNSLFAYWLCQGWGNDPIRFEGDFWQLADNYQQQPDNDNHEAFIEHLYNFSHWHYTLDSSPKLVVLDSRTQRWRSEFDIAHPSGLMDWEAMCNLQQELIGHNAIVLVSPAPIFGVKAIEAIQRLATGLGKPLAVDAENWMAHTGSASTILNIFTHPKTPHHFVILSGDVHYSFVYDIELRFRHYSPKIWQITSSGIKNQFPSKLISCLDSINRWLYGAYSPLNLFTKRRAMKIKARNVIDQHPRRLIERSGLGMLELNDDGSPSKICDIHNDGSQTVFVSSNDPD